MKALDDSDVFAAAAKGLGKWCLKLSFNTPVYGEKEVLKAAPCLMELEPFDRLTFLSAQGGVLVFTSERAARKAYSSTVGEDGPTKTNHYTGMCIVYACLCGPDGKIRTENT